MKLAGAIGIVALMGAFGCDDEGTTVAPTSVPPADLAAAPPASTDMATTPGAVQDMARPPTAQTVMVTVGPNNSLSFSPATVTIHPGDTVTWNWSSSSIPHSVTSGSPGAPSGTFDSGVHTAPFTFSHTFPSAGSFPYFCTVHGALMTGTVTVQ
jgi:plastocyanin